MKKLSALVLALTVGISTFAGCSATQGSKNSTDVVVIGAGGGGLAAAVEATDQGARVIVLEKMPMVGGNTNRATGGLNAAGTKYQKEKGIQDSVELFYNDAMKGGYNKNDPELVRNLAEKSVGTVDWLTGLGADLSDVGRMAGASVDRTHRPKGGAAVGAHVVEVLKKAADSRKIDIRLWNKATEILTDKEGKVIGVKATNKEGKEYKINARNVILASGGFSANQEMVVQYDPKLKGFSTTNHAGATGEVIIMATKVGAALVDMDQIQTHPTVVPGKAVMVTEAVRGNGAILVNRDAKRFTNELLTRDVVSAAILEQKGKTAYLVFDEGIRKSLSAVEEYFNMNLVSEFNTLDEMASKLEMNKDTLKATIDDYNKAVETKTDAEFKRADMPRALKTAKYYAIEVGPAVHHTMGGVKINTQAQVISEAGKLIPGLFAAGEVTGGVHGGNRLGGNAMADIVTYGRIAGENAAKASKVSK